MDTIDTSTSVSSGPRSVLGTLSTWVILGVVALLPFFFIPSVLFSFSFTKVFLVVLGVLIPFFLWLISRLKEGKLELPKGYLFLSALAVPLSYLLASLFSGVMKISFIGQGFEVDTFASILLFFLLFFLVPIYFNRYEKLTKIYFALFVSFIVVAIFQMLRIIFGVDFLSFGGLLSNSTSNLVGKWNDLGVFFGLFTLLFFSTMELLPTKGMMRILLFIGFIISLIFTAIINFTAVWVFLGLSALFFFVYKILFRSVGDTSSNSSEWSISQFLTVPSSLVFALSIVFVVMGSTAGDFINRTISISQLEVRPSWSATFEVGQSALTDDLLFGAGPNRFGIEWLQNKPEGINETVFWNTDFNSGIGFVPTALTSTGVVGFLAWLSFIVLLLLYGLRAVFASGTEDRVARYVSLSSLLGTLFLWTFALIYVPNVTILALTFIFTGIFVATQMIAGRIKTIRVSFIQSPKLGFVSVFFIILLLIGTLGLGYVYGKKFVSFVVFQNALSLYADDGDSFGAEERLERAIRLNESDLYYRSLAELHMIELNSILVDTERDPDDARSAFQERLAKAINAASLATSYDNRNYKNWRVLGDIYSSLITLGVDGAYDNAVNTYNRALELNPHSPALYLTLARVEASNENMEGARDLVQRALQEKNNYTEAVFFLSQIEIGEGKIQEAIAATQAAVTIAPNDPTLFFQLGILYYNEEQYNEALSALEQAVGISPQYSNAKYFLGLTYYELGRVAEAITQFEEVASTNPGNQELVLILSNLREGKEPFDGAEPLGNPEERDTLPITEDITTGE